MSEQEEVRSGHHIEITYGRSRKDRTLHIDGHDVSGLVRHDGVNVQFTEVGPVVTLTMIPTWLDIVLDGAEVEIEDGAETEEDTNG